MIIVVVVGSGSIEPEGAGNSAAATGHGDVGALLSAFGSWREIYERNGGSPELLRLAMGYSRALSEARTDARGRLDLNLLDGSLTLQVKGLEDGGYELWLVDDGTDPGNSVRVDGQDRALRVGALESKEGLGELRERLSRERLAGFALDSAVLTRPGRSPREGVVIAGSPDLLTKVYYSTQRWSLAHRDDAPGAEQQATPAWDFLLPPLANADDGRDLAAVLGAKVAEGRKLFHQETFNGNGRTCGTCHRADNNFTIDPNYIAQLPPDDKLFVAETDPNLAELENPALMRKFGLILANVDGAGTSIFRSVPHTLALATSVVSESTNPQPPYTKGEFEADNGLQGATGWAGDGAPGTGTLREFASGAVVQHFPKTLARNSNPDDDFADDFRLPSAEELDAIEAYELALGRSKDYPVYKLTFLDPVAEAGKLLFDTKENPCVDGSAQSGGPTPPPTCSGAPITEENVAMGSTANCNGCHTHAGARSSTTFANPTRNTGVEDLKINPARLVDPTLAYDGGFGQDASSACGPQRNQSCFGDGRFNTPPLVEAADTAPYFHNNSVSTLEEAIASYNSDAFNRSPGSVTSKSHDRRVKLDSSQVTAVASFLRAINALENIRISNRLDNQALAMGSRRDAKELARLAQAENEDAVRVLREGAILGGYAEAVAKLETAGRYQRMAIHVPSRGLRKLLLTQAIASKQEAKALIAHCDDGAAKPATVTLSPAGFTYSCSELDAL